MDTLTHALSGALLARATAGSEKPALPLGRRVAVGALVAAFPDLDIVATWLSPLAYLYHHRGVTHSLVMLPLWTVLLAWLFAWIWRGGPRFGRSGGGRGGGGYGCIWSGGSRPDGRRGARGVWCGFGRGRLACNTRPVGLRWRVILRPLPSYFV